MADGRPCEDVPRCDTDSTSYKAGEDPIGANQLLAKSDGEKGLAKAFRKIPEIERKLCTRHFSKGFGGTDLKSVNNALRTKTTASAEASLAELSVKGKAKIEKFIRGEIIPACSDHVEYKFNPTTAVAESGMHVLATSQSGVPPVRQSNDAKTCMQRVMALQQGLFLR
jgi:hypothetical protein